MNPTQPPPSASPRPGRRPRPSAPPRPTVRDAPVAALAVALAAALAAGLCALAPLAALASDAQRERARELIEAERPEAALPLLEETLGRDPNDAEGLLLRSTARFMTGDPIRGEQDLERALELDPTLRQGWLNLAALRMAEGAFAQAVEAFREARELDPSNPDTLLNIGAAQLLGGTLEPASKNFAAYLEARPGSGEAHYLVASNYAIAGYAALAIQHLDQAVALDERLRLRARTDPAFEPLAQNPELRRLFTEDPYRPPADAHVAERSVASRYDASQGPLLGQVVDALEAAGIAFDRRVEVTPAWALLWADFRIKVSDGEDGRGRVQLSAPAGALSPEQWQRASRTFFQQLDRAAGGSDG